jgi:hypothetical protein
MTLDPQPSGDAGYERLRASTQDRERAIDVLKSGFAEGRLTKEEYDDRTGQVYSSRTYAELAVLTADLPAGPLGAVSPQPYPVQPQGYAVRPAGGKTNGLAIASLVCALIPGFPWFVAIGLGFAARGQIRERGDRGIGLANAGIAISGFFVLVAVIFGLTQI